MMTDLNNPTEFAKALRSIDLINEPEAIRNRIDQDRESELLQSKAGNFYHLVDGELKKVEA